MDMIIPPRRISIMLESNHLKSIMLVGRLGVHGWLLGLRRSSGHECVYVYIYIYIYIYIIQRERERDTCIEICMDEWTHGRMDAWTHGRMDAWTHGCGAGGSAGGGEYSQVPSQQ